MPSTLFPQKDNDLQTLWNIYRSGGNPAAVLNQIVGSNPSLQNIMRSGNLKDTFYQMCNERGVNPDSILNQFR